MGGGGKLTVTILCGVVNVVTTVDVAVLSIEGPISDSSTGICASDDFSSLALAVPGEVGWTGVTVSPVCGVSSRGL